MPDSTPNHYELRSQSVTINYGPDLQGQTNINYTIGNSHGTAHKADIHTVSIDNVGKVFTFALKPGPDADEGNPQFSFLLPNVTLQGNNQFDTIGFTTHTTRQGPGHQRYAEVKLHGTASAIETVKAKHGG